MEWVRRRREYRRKCQEDVELFEARRELAEELIRRGQARLAELAVNLTVNLNNNEEEA